MKRQGLKQGLLTLLVAMMTLAWVGSASGFPGVMGQWQGFQADEKGFPGWCPNDQHRIPGQQNGKSNETVELYSTTIPQLADHPGYPGGPRGEGGRGGQHPGDHAQQ